jgi:hypothetical protein
MSSNDLVARYVHAVTANLPKGERDDVARELDSLIEEMLAERAAAQGTEVNEPLTVAVLRELGQPDVVAERYGQPRPHFVGPAYYPTFKAVTGIVIGVLGILALVGAALSLAMGHTPVDEVLRSLPHWLIEFTMTALANVGLIALIFATIERFMPPGTGAEDDWDPRELPRVDDPNRLDRGNQAFDLGFDIVVFVLFNYFVSRGQVPFILLGTNEMTQQWAALSPAFMAWVPWINALIVFGIALDAFLLWRGRWQPITRLARLAENVVSGYILIQLLALERIAVTPWMDVLCRLGVVVLLVIVVVDGLRQLFKLLGARRSSVYAPVSDAPTGP